MKPISHSFAACSFVVLAATAVPSVLSSTTKRGHKAVPTFAKDVAPILYSKCAPCHHSGEVAPFALTSYEDARDKAPTLALAVKQKYMPPWQALTHGEFQNERTLTPAQIETLDAWAKAGAPKGNMASAPKPPTYSSGWSIGEPDLIAKPSQAYAVSAEGADEYRCFVIPTNFPDGRFVSAVEVKPGNRHVVHHIIAYLDKSGVARKREGKDGKPGYASFGGPGFVPVGSLGGWAPGLQPEILPLGDGMLLPQGADIVIQVHYHKNGKLETDLSQVGIKFAKGPIDKRVHWESVDNELITIQPGDSHYEVTADLDLPAPITVLDVIPHMHLIGHDMTVTATLPNGTKKELIHVDPYDFNWQTRYTYKEPVHLPKGTHLALVAHYDNSSANPHNPNNPPKKVIFGEQTTNEMCFAFFSYTFDSEHVARGIKVNDDQGLEAQRRGLTVAKIFDHFDTNHDGFLDVSELADVVQFFQSALDDPSKKPEDPKLAARFLVALYGKTEKGKLNLEEFKKMAKEMK